MKQRTNYLNNVSNAVLLLIAFSGLCNCSLHTAPYPTEIGRALERIDTIPDGMVQRDVFDYLGLKKPISGREDDSIEGRTGITWSRYKIHPLFVLECESKIRPLSGVDFEDGTLLSATIRKVNVFPDWTYDYVNLRPSFHNSGN